MIGGWRASKDFAIRAADTLVFLSDTLGDVHHLLDVASTTLNGAGLAMDGLYTTTLDMSGTLSSTRIAFDETAALTEADLPKSIEASLVALETFLEPL